MVTFNGHNSVIALRKHTPSPPLIQDSTVISSPVFEPLKVGIREVLSDE